mmetsp:Transcript_126377/g.393349  ORF Transcript_126377/g.393349 Transcript_126377/m.393349 type:complete len:114 (-) Transcript_126377:18-359(-)
MAPFRALALCFATGLVLSHGLHEMAWKAEGSEGGPSGKAGKAGKEVAKHKDVLLDRHVRGLNAWEAKFVKVYGGDRLKGKAETSDFAKRAFTIVAKRADREAGKLQPTPMAKI